MSLPNPYPVFWPESQTVLPPITPSYQTAPAPFFSFPSDSGGTGERGGSGRAPQTSRSGAGGEARRPSSAAGPATWTGGRAKRGARRRPSGRFGASGPARSVSPGRRVAAARRVGGGLCAGPGGAQKSAEVWCPPPGQSRSRTAAWRLGGRSTHQGQERGATVGGEWKLAVLRERYLAWLTYRPRRLRSRPPPARLRRSLSPPRAGPQRADTPALPAAPAPLPPRGSRRSRPAPSLPWKGPGGDRALRWGGGGVGWGGVGWRGGAERGAKLCPRAGPLGARARALGGLRAARAHPRVRVRRTAARGRAGHEPRLPQVLPPLTVYYTSPGTCPEEPTFPKGGWLRV